MRWGAFLGVMCLSLGSAAALAQATMADGRSDGEDLAKAIRDATSDSILADGAEAGVPGYAGTDFAESAMVDDVAALDTAGELQRSTNPTYSVVVDTTRPRFDPTTIDLSAADAIEDDPDAYLGTGFTLDGSTGECEALPGSGTGVTEYFESCNDGSVVEEFPLTCSVVAVDNSQYGYTCQEVQIYIPAHRVCVKPTRVGCQEYADVPEQIVETVNSCGNIDASCTAGATSTTELGTHETYEYYGKRIPRDVRRISKQYVCDSEHSTSPAVDSAMEFFTEWRRVSKTAYYVPDGPAYHIPAVAETYDGRVGSGSYTIDETDCLNKTATLQCTQSSQVCVANDASGTCVEWERTYDCTRRVSKNDCSVLDARPECTFDHRECLSEDADGTCNIYDEWYRCTTGEPVDPDAEEFICSGDLYCLDGECTEIEREASTEFKDAMVAVQTMGELRDDFDPDTLRLFGGENLKCTKKLFGISNCCSGKGVPLITPFLCSAEDRLVDEKDDAGLCAYVGSYCSDKVLGVCVTKKQSYCCFSSKLTRILQEQGRAQLGLDFGTPKETTCEGLTVEQFQQLDLSLMDFTEVYEEFTEAAKLPDEIEAGILIQERIAEYYNLHTAP